MNLSARYALALQARGKLSVARENSHLAMVWSAVGPSCVCFGHEDESTVLPRSIPPELPNDSNVPGARGSGNARAGGGERESPPAGTLQAGMRLAGRCARAAGSIVKRAQHRATAAIESIEAHDAAHAAARPRSTTSQNCNTPRQPALRL